MAPLRATVPGTVATRVQRGRRRSLWVLGSQRPVITRPGSARWMVRVTVAPSLNVTWVLNAGRRVQRDVLGLSGSPAHSAPRPGALRA